MSPGHTRRVLLILPRLALPPDCSASFTVSRWGSHYSAAVFRVKGGRSNNECIVLRSDKGKSSTVFSSCSSTQHPVILSGEPQHSNIATKAFIFPFSAYVIHLPSLYAVRRTK